MELSKPYDLRLEAYTSILVFGSSSAGKSSLGVKIALNRETIFNKPHQKTIIFYQNSQDLFLQTKEADESIILVSTRDELEKELESSESCLLICDDFLLLASEAANRKFITKFFVQGCHHLKITLIWQSQLLFPRYGKEWTVNANHFILFKSFQTQQIETFFRNFGSDASFLYEIYRRCTFDKKYGYMFMSVHPKTSDRLRYRNSIFNEEGVEIYEQT